MTSDLPARVVVGGADGREPLASPTSLSPVERVLAALCVLAGIGAIVVNVVGLAGWLA